MLSSHAYADRRMRMRIDAEGMRMRIDVDAVVALSLFNSMSALSFTVCVLTSLNIGTRKTQALALTKSLRARVKEYASSR